MGCRYLGNLGPFAGNELHQFLFFKDAQGFAQRTAAYPHGLGQLRFQDPFTRFQLVADDTVADRPGNLFREVFGCLKHHCFPFPTRLL